MAGPLAKKKCVDFAKVKLKVGKKKEAAYNATCTAISIKDLYIPLQLPAQQPALPKTVRGLVLPDLLTQTKHYSAATRKDALVGCREILGKDAAYFLANTGIVLEAISKLMLDEDGAVRGTLRVLLQDLFLLLSPAQFSPFKEKLIAYTQSTLSHLRGDVRLDGLRYLGLLIMHYPETLHNSKEKVIMACGFLFLRFLKHFFT